MNGGCRVKQCQEARRKKEEEKQKEEGSTSGQPGNLTMSDKLKAVLMTQYAMGADEIAGILSQVDSQGN